MLDDDGVVNRPVTLLEVKLIALDTNNKIDILTASVQAMGAMLGETRIQVATNTKEVDTLRGHQHDLAGTVQVMKINSELLTPDTRRELTRLLPDIKELLAVLKRRGVSDFMTPAQLALVQTLERELGEDKLKTLADQMEQRFRHAARWYQMPREIIGAGIGIGLLVIANHVDAFWHALFH